MQQIILDSIDLLFSQGKQKEYHCHIKFVAKIARELAKTYDRPQDILEIAGLLHDIGRDQELPGEHHAETGARITRIFLDNYLMDEKNKELIIGCVIHHNDHENPLTLDQKIIMTADSASKILYHEAFMLMCKKETWQERVVRGMKYLEKGLRGIQFPEYKEQVIMPRYSMLKQVYDEVLSSN